MKRSEDHERSGVLRGSVWASNAREDCLVSLLGEKEDEQMDRDSLVPRTEQGKSNLGILTFAGN